MQQLLLHRGPLGWCCQYLMRPHLQTATAGSGGRKAGSQHILLLLLLLGVVMALVV
jgi:hypothetical protein